MDVPYRMWILCMSVLGKKFYSEFVVLYHLKAMWANWISYPKILLFQDMASLVLFNCWDPWLASYILCTENCKGFRCKVYVPAGLTGFSTCVRVSSQHCAWPGLAVLFPRWFQTFFSSPHASPGLRSHCILRPHPSHHRAGGFCGCWILHHLWRKRSK